MLAPRLFRKSKVVVLHLHRSFRIILVLHVQLFLAAGSFLGIYFNLSSPVGLAIESSKMRSKPIWSPSFYQSSTFPTGSGGECTIWSVNELQSKGSIDFESLESAQFTADRFTQLNALCKNEC